jgi:hypothetical protein
MQLFAPVMASQTTLQSSERFSVQNVPEKYVCQQSLVYLMRS